MNGSTARDRWYKYENPFYIDFIPKRSLRCRLFTTFNNLFTFRNSLQLNCQEKTNQTGIKNVKNTIQKLWSIILRDRLKSWLIFSTKPLYFHINLYLFVPLRYFPYLFTKVCLCKYQKPHFQPLLFQGLA